MLLLVPIHFDLTNNDSTVQHKLFHNDYHQQVSLKGFEQEKRVLVPWKNAEVLLPAMANIEILSLSVSS